MAKLKWVDGRTESKNCAESLRIHPCFQSSFNWTKAKIIQLSMTTNSKETMVHNYSVYVILSPSLTVAVEQAYWKECWTKFTMRCICPFKLEKRQSLNSILIYLRISDDQSLLHSTGKETARKVCYIWSSKYGHVAAMYSDSRGKD